MISEVVLCAVSLIEPAGCLGMGHPAAQLYQTQCQNPDIISVSPKWRAGEWMGQSICWHPTKSGDVVIAEGAQPFFVVKTSPTQARCVRVQCTPDINTQLRSNKGTK